MIVISRSSVPSRIITNSDLDAIVSCVLLKRVEPIGAVKYLPLERLRAGEFSSLPVDIVVNMPYIEDCGLWFDHHDSNQPPDQFEGRYDQEAPSAARVIYDYYSEAGEQDAFDGLEQLLAETDRVDDARFTKEDIINPQGAVLVSYLIYAHPMKNGTVAENNLMIELLDSGDPADVLEHPVFVPKKQEFLNRLEKSQPVLKQEIELRDGVMVLDFRELEEERYGLCDNKFLPFVLFPERHTLVRIKSLGEDRVKLTLGFNMFQDPENCPIHYGDLLSNYEGGGHRRAAGCSLPATEADDLIEEIIEAVQSGETEPGGDSR